MKLRSLALFMAVACPGVAVMCITLKAAGLFAEKWQTLIAGFLAIIAAFIGGTFINRQIASTQRLEEDKRQRQFAAARAIMPIVLGEAIDFSVACAVALKRLYQQRDGERIPPTAELPDLPSLPLKLAQGLHDTIVHADGEVYRPVADLLGNIQVIAARLKSLWSDLPRAEHVVVALNIEGYIVDCAEAHARSSLMFEFARRRTSSIKTSPTSRDIAASLRNIGFPEEEYDRVHATAERRFGANAWTATS